MKSTVVMSANRENDYKDATSDRQPSAAGEASCELTIEHSDGVNDLEMNIMKPLPSIQPIKRKF